MKTQFQPGDRVYDIEGMEYNYLMRTHRGHLAEPVHVDDEEGEHFGKQVVLFEVFEKPPIPKIDAEVEKRQKELSALNLQVSEVQNRLRVATSDLTQLKSKLQEHVALRRIDDVLSGRFTHVALLSLWHPKVAPVNEVLTGEESGSWRGKDHQYKLVVLFGKSGGDLSWQANHYKDGSGSWDEILLCFSEEEALARMQERYDAHVAEWRKSPNDYSSRRAAFEWGTKIPQLRVPKDVLEARNREKRADLEKAVLDQQAVLEKAKKKLDEFDTPVLPTP